MQKKIFSCSVLLMIFFSSSPLRLYSQEITNSADQNKHPDIISTTKQGYEIQGHIMGLEEGEKVSMVLYPFNGKFHDFRDSAFVKNGRFQITGMVPDGPRFYWMIFNKRLNYIILHINNNERITISSNSDIKTLPNQLQHIVNIEGSPTMSAALKLMPAIYNYKSNVRSINSSARIIVDSIGFNGPILNTLFSTRELIRWNFYNDFLKDQAWNTESAKLIFIEDIISESGRAAFLVNIYNRLDEKAKNSFYGKRFKEYIGLTIGQLFPEFSLPTPSGKLLSLRDIVAKSKVTLVHFWATNSYLREEYQRELKVLYKKYHDKGLNIVSISADTADYIWKGYLNANPDQYPWYNVSDLKGYRGGSIIQDVYKEGGHTIPNTTNYLIDDKGRIIAYDPRGAELQYYLWKTFGE